MDLARGCVGLWPTGNESARAKQRNENKMIWIMSWISVETHLICPWFDSRTKIGQPFANIRRGVWSRSDAFPLVECVVSLVFQIWSLRFCIIFRFFRFFKIQIDSTGRLDTNPFIASFFCAPFNAFVYLKQINFQHARSFAGCTAAANHTQTHSFRSITTR